MKKFKLLIISGGVLIEKEIICSSYETSNSVYSFWSVTDKGYRLLSKYPIDRTIIDSITDL